MTGFLVRKGCAPQPQCGRHQEVLVVVPHIIIAFFTPLNFIALMQGESKICLVRILVETLARIPDPDFFLWFESKQCFDVP
jgi:hypothetical protein